MGSGHETMLERLAWLGESWSMTDVIFGWIDRHCMIPLCSNNLFVGNPTTKASCRAYHCSVVFLLWLTITDPL